MFYFDGLLYPTSIAQEPRTTYLRTFNARFEAQQYQVDKSM